MALKPLTSDQFSYFLNSLDDLGSILTNNDEHEVVFKEILHLVMGTLGVSRGAILIYSARTRELAVTTHRGLEWEAIALDVPAGVVDAMLDEKRDVVFVEKSDGVLKEYFSEYKSTMAGLNAKVWVPLSFKKTFLGVLSLGSKLKNAELEEIDLTVLRIIAHVLSNALYNFALVDKMKAKNKALDLKVLELETLQDVSAAIVSVLDIDTLTEEVLQRSVSILDSKSGALMLTDRQSLVVNVEALSEFLHVASTFEVDAKDVEAVIVSKNSEDLALCFREKEGQILNKCADKRLAKAFGAQNLLIAPIRSKSEVIGLIIVGDKESRRGVVEFQESDLKLLEMFANQAGIALDNARLFKNVIEVKEFNESILTSVNSGVITINMIGEIGSVNQAATTIFRKHRRQIVGQHFESLFDKDPEILKLFERVRGTHHAVSEMNLSCRSVAKDMVVNLSVAPLKGPDGEVKGLVVVIEDISAESRIKSTFKRYVTSNIVDQILADEGKLKLGGDRRHVTVLFSDIRDFTAMSEKMDPEKVVSTLNEYFTDMIEIVFRFDGTLDKIIGDELMVVYGAPIQRKDDAERAVKTALEMVAHLKKLNKDRKKRGLVELAMGIGLSSGVVVSGNIGSSQRMDYTVIGDTVNLGSRLCAIAKPGEIIVSEPVFEAVKDLFPFKKLDPVQVKGKADPIQIYHLT